MKLLDQIQSTLSINKKLQRNQMQVPQFLDNQGQKIRERTFHKETSLVIDFLIVLNFFLEKGNVQLKPSYFL